MTFFRERNKLRNEYSGYQEATQGLRERIAAIFEHYIAEGYIGIGQEHWWIPAGILNHEIKLYLNKTNVYQALLSGAYDEVFEAIEIFISVAKEQCRSQRYEEIFVDITKAFYIAGSVYFVDSRSGQVALQIEEKLAKDLQVAGDILTIAKEGKEGFFNAIGGLMSRKVVPEDVVKGAFVAFEDYLKMHTGGKDYGESIVKLEKEGVVSPTQKALLEKIYAYRSDTYGVGHAGNSGKPKEIDALWFIETVTAQLLFIDRKLKQNHV